MSEQTTFWGKIKQNLNSLTTIFQRDKNAPLALPQPSNPKYRITNDIRIIQSKGEEITLYRIQALRDFVWRSPLNSEESVILHVKKGDFGGFIQSEANLSIEGRAWISENAMAYGSAIVKDNALLTGNACVTDYAQIIGNALVKDTAIIKDEAIIRDNAIIAGAILVRDNVLVGSDIYVYGSSSKTLTGQRQYV